MPRKPTWNALVPGILASLKMPAMPPFLDRPAVERLFEVGRRQAIRLMALSGGYQVGKTFLVDRGAMTKFLEDVLKGGGPAEALERKRRVADAIAEAEAAAAAQRAEIRPDPRVLERRRPALPPAVSFAAPGELRITYQNAEDLLARIGELAAIAAKDFRHFVNLVESATESNG